MSARRVDRRRIPAVSALSSSCTAALGGCGAAAPCEPAVGVGPGEAVTGLAAAPGEGDSPDGVAATGDGKVTALTADAGEVSMEISPSPPGPSVRALASGVTANEWGDITPPAAGLWSAGT
jgi:hypothetical protein